MHLIWGKQISGSCLKHDVMRTIEFLEFENSFSLLLSVEETLSYNEYKFMLVNPQTRIKVYLYFSWYSHLPNFEK